jgi:serine phosphatase RsbU (regulator of sigma subunit)
MRKKDKVKKGKKTILENQLEKQQAVLHSAEKEIYENISQCLCLARMQLGSIKLDDRENSLAQIGEANMLIGKAVKDLRNLAKRLSVPGIL